MCSPTFFEFGRRQKRVENNFENTSFFKGVCLTISTLTYKLLYLIMLNFQVPTLNFNFKWNLIGTLYNDILRIARNLLETRENIKIESHPFYHIICD